MVSKDKQHPESKQTRYGNAKQSVERRGGADKRNIVKHTPDENIGAASGADNYKG